MMYVILISEKLDNIIKIEGNKNTMKYRGNNQGIDFVITWVDGSDKKWQEEKARTLKVLGIMKETDDRKERYRDWGNLQYWFRGVEQYAPWVRRIHFVTWGHIPEWLNTKHPKLHVVKHEDFIPAKYLPTFNSHTIEWNLHRIKGLAEQFVYFNDDVFLLNKIKETDFFQKGLPVDMLALQPDIANVENEIMPYIYLNNAMILAKYFQKYENVKKQPGAYFHIGYPPIYFIYNILEMAFPKFTGFYTVHGPSPLKKSTYEELWNLEPELLEKVCKHPLRHKEDINQYVLREYQKLKGRFVPKNVHKMCKYSDVQLENKELIRRIEKSKTKIICINDSNHKIDFEKAKKEINQALEHKFKKKSSFEK